MRNECLDSLDSLIELIDYNLADGELFRLSDFTDTSQSAVVGSFHDPFTNE